MSSNLSPRRSADEECGRQVTKVSLREAVLNRLGHVPGVVSRLVERPLGFGVLAVPCFFSEATAGAGGYPSDFWMGPWVEPGR